VLDVHQAAERAGVSVWTIWRRAWDGTLRVARHGTGTARTLLDAASVDAYIASKRDDGPEASRAASGDRRVSGERGAG